MNFMLTKEQENFKMEVKELTEKYVTPFAAENDKYSSFPKKSIEVLSQNGIMGIPFEKKYGGLGFDNLTYITAVEELSKGKYSSFPKKSIEVLSQNGIMGIPFEKKYGGLGFDNLTYITAVEELSKGCASTGVIMSAHTSLCSCPISEYGTEKQKEKYLTPLAKGEKIGAFGWTEAEAGTKTTAVRDVDSYIINGRKVLITNSHEASVFVVFAKTDFDNNKLSAFIVEKGTKGFSVGEAEEKMGVRGSSTSELIFENCVVPKENLLGEEGKGFEIAMATLNGGRIGVAAQAVGIAQGALDAAVKYVKERVQNGKRIGKGFEIAMATLNGGRIGVAAQAVGIAQGALDAAVKYVKERVQNGKRISQFQNTQFVIAKLQTKIDAARLMTYRAANLKDLKENYGYMASMAKLFASETAMEVTTKAVQLFGGNGYSKKYPVERMMRDAKVTEIYEGTSEVQKIVIANALNIN